MSKDLESKTKKELLDIIDQLRGKLEEMQQVEAKQESLESQLGGKAFSIIQDVQDKFKLVEISFDMDTKVGKITKVEEIFPSNYEFALFQGKKFLVDNIMSKQNLNHLKEKKNG